MNPQLPAPVKRWRTRLLITEFGALAILIGTLKWFATRQQQGLGLEPVWLLLPAVASLILFLSFLGLMYLRWAAAMHSQVAPAWRRTLFGVFAVMLLMIWAFAMLQTWQSMQVTGAGA